MNTLKKTLISAGRRDQSLFLKCFGTVFSGFFPERAAWPQASSTGRPGRDFPVVRIRISSR